MMKRNYILYLLMLMASIALPSVVYAQSEGDEDDDVVDEYIDEQDAVYFYKKDGSLQALLDMEIDSIMFSFNDKNQVRYSNPVRQVIYSGDSIYSIMLQDIDSVGLYTPEMKFNSDVFIIDEDNAQYVIAVDSISFTLAKECPVRPTMNQPIFSLYREGILEEGNCNGRVYKIERVPNGYRYILTLKDYDLLTIFSQCITANMMLTSEYENGEVRRTCISSARSPRRAKATSGKEASKGFFDKIKSLNLGKFKFGGDGLFSTSGAWVEYQGWTKYFPKKAEEDDYTGVYMGFGVVPRLTLKIPFQTNVSKWAFLEGSLTTSPKKSYVKVGVEIDVDVRAFAEAGLKVKTKEKPASKDDVLDAMIDGLDEMFAETFSNVKKGKTPQLFTKKSGFHLTLVPALPILDIEFEIFNPKFDFYSTLIKGSAKAEMFDIYGNANFHFGAGAEIYKDENDDWTCEGYTDGPTVTFNGGVRIGGDFDFFMGIEPKLKIGIVRTEIANLTIGIPAGAYIKGALDLGVDFNSGDVLEALKTPTNELSSSDLDRLSYKYDHYFKDNNYVSAGLRIGLKPSVEILEVAEGTIADGLHNSFPIEFQFGSGAKENQTFAEGLIHDALAHDWELIGFHMAPKFKRTDAVFQNFTNIVSYEAHGLVPYNTARVGALVVDIGDKTKCWVRWAEEPYKKTFTEFGSEEYRFVFPNLVAGHTYAAYPIFSTYDMRASSNPELFKLDNDVMTSLYANNIIICSPRQEFVAPASMTTGTMTSTGSGDELQLSVVESSAAGFDNPNQTMGVVYVDAGQLTNIDPNNLKMEDIDVEKMNFVYYDKDVLVKLADGMLPKNNTEFALPELSLPGKWKGGQRLYYSLFYSPDGKDDMRHVTFSDVKSYFTPGMGFSINLMNRGAEMDRIRVVGNVSWLDALPIDKSQMTLWLRCRKKGSTEWDKEQGIITADIINSYDFEAILVNLEENLTYEYQLCLKYNDGDETIEAQSPIVEAKTTRAPKIAAIDNFKCVLQATNDRAARFVMSADWKPSDTDKVEMGIIYYRAKKSPGAKNLTYDSSLKNVVVYPYKGDYTEKRGEDIVLSVENLRPTRPTSPDKHYFYRPFFCIWNDGTREKIMSTEVADDDGTIISDNFDTAIFWTDPKTKIKEQKLVVHGAASEFYTEASGSGVAFMAHAISEPVEMPDGSFMYHTTPLGLSDMASSGIITTPGKAKLTKNADGTFIIPAKKGDKNAMSALAQRMSKERAKARRHAPGDVGDDDEEDEEDAEIEAQLTEPLVANDLSALKDKEKYRYRAYYEAKDGVIIYSDEYEMTYNKPEEKPNDKEDEQGNAGTGDIPDDVVLSLTAGEPVDLGLSVKWCSTNIGAAQVDEYGNYYSWGETTTKSDYSDENYTYPSTDVFGDLNIGNGTHDAAKVALGDGWRMPTEAEAKELVDGCNWLWTSLNGVPGMLGTSKVNGVSIFFPAAGNMYGQQTYSNGEGGCYWTSNVSQFVEDPDNPYSDNPTPEELKEIVKSRDAARLHFHKGHIAVEDGRCYFGRTIRPVKQ